MREKKDVHIEISDRYGEKIKEVSHIAYEDYKRFVTSKGRSDLDIIVYIASMSYFMDKVKQDLYDENYKQLDATIKYMLALKTTFKIQEKGDD